MTSEQPGSTDNDSQPNDALARLRARARRPAADASMGGEPPAEQATSPAPEAPAPEAPSDASPSTAPSSTDVPGDPPDIATDDSAATGDTEAEATVRSLSLPDETAAAETGEPTPGRSRSLVVAGVAVMVVVAVLASVMAGILMSRSSADRAARDARPAIISAAASSLTALLSYDYAHLAADQASAKAGLTASFAATYERYLNSQVAPTATKYHAVSTTTVSSLAIVTNSATHATVLAFTDQTLSDTQIKGQSTSLTRERIGMVHENGKWLIDSVSTL